MKKLFFILTVVLWGAFNQCVASNGDSIFNIPAIHTLHLTFPYPDFYDSLIATNTTDVYLKVAVDFNGESYQDVGIKVKGNSSFNNPSQKKSFKLDFNEYVAGQDIHGLKKLNFNNSFKDPSFMREKLANDFLRAHGAPAPRVTYCNVYMNGELWGLYTIVENIDDEFCKRWFNSNDGNLFQGDPHGDLKWLGNAQANYTPNYDLENNNTTNDWSDLIQLINVINNTGMNNLYPALDSVFNTQNFVKQWATLNLFSSLDSYIGSGHNYYIYHDTITDKFEWIGWDMNETFGTFKMNLTSAQLQALDVDYMNTPTAKPLTNNMLLNPTYQNLYHQAYCELYTDFNLAYFSPQIDSLYNAIQSSVYADPKKFYSNADFNTNINTDVISTGPQTMTIFGLKSFISTRNTTAQTSLTSHNVVCTSAIYDATNPQVVFYPNPTSDKLTLIENSITAKSYRIFSITGELLSFGTIQNDEIDMQLFDAGIYLLEVVGENQQIYRGKVLKM